VDAVVPASKFAAEVCERAQRAAAKTDRPRTEPGVELTAIERIIAADEIRYRYVSVAIDRARRCATITVATPSEAAPGDLAAIKQAGVDYWALAAARELDDAILHLRANETEIGTWLLQTSGDHEYIATIDAGLHAFRDDWFVREVRLYWKRVLKRLDVSSRSLIAAIGPGSCFSGTLLEIALSCDQTFMLDGAYEGDPRPPAEIRLGELNFGAYPMVNGLTRLESRFLHEPAHVDALRARVGESLDAGDADVAGLVTFNPDDIDWDDELRIVVESRASFSPDALTGMEANLRFAGPETMESKIFSRLSAWQNWIFQRPNAVGENGALVLYGTGARPDYTKQRV
jgi:benzoyl-CoA-dihydrodiol lyase